MTTIDLIIDFFKKAQRQGPGSKADTLRALSMVHLNSKKLKIADIGCGSGGQTITLAQHLEGDITAIDLFNGFLEEVNVRAKNLGLGHKIQTLQASMDQLPFEEASLDLIWSEGAIYNIGFEAGIKNWRNFLKPGAYLAVSEITWITSNRPSAIEDFWKKEYPAIDSASNKIRILENNGYTLTGYFYLPKGSWITEYYEPLAEQFDEFLERHHSSEDAQRIVREHQAEIELYQKYQDYYSYGFYVAQKV